MKVSVSRASPVFYLYPAPTQSGSAAVLQWMGIRRVRVVPDAECVGSVSWPWLEGLALFDSDRTLLRLFVRDPELGRWLEWCLNAQPNRASTP